MKLNTVLIHNRKHWTDVKSTHFLKNDKNGPNTCLQNFLQNFLKKYPHLSLEISLQFNRINL